MKAKGPPSRRLPYSLYGSARRNVLAARIRGSAPRRSRAFRRAGRRRLRLGGRRLRLDRGRPRPSRAWRRPGRHRPRLSRACRRLGRGCLRLARRLPDLAFRLVLPRPCLACSAPAERELGLCAACRRLLDPPPRNAPGEDLPEGCDACFWLWDYRPPFDRVVLGLKYRRLDYLGLHIAAEANARLATELQRADVVVPMPMHWRRRLARGRNQAESIARPLARRLGVPLSPALRRRTLGKPQVGRGRRQRLANPGIVIACKRPARVRDRVVLLVDDVVTTGATAGRAASALKTAGAAKVILFAAARTPT